MIWLWLACVMTAPPAPTPPDDGHGSGGGGDDTDACGTCTLINCQDTDVPTLTTEDECEDAAFSYDCEDYEWDDCR